MLGPAIGGLLPTAVGVAMSPVPIVAVILMLGTPKARSNGIAFAVGWVAGLTVASVIVLVVAGGADTSSSTDDAVNGVTLALGILLLVLAAKQWRGRPAEGEEAEMPKWMEAIDEFSAGKSFGFGVLLSAVNPKNLALTVAASASIAQAGLSTGESAIAVAVFVVLGSLTVAGPVAFYLVAADKARGPLASIKAFMSAHNNAIMAVILLVLGVKLLGAGMGGLTD